MHHGEWVVACLAWKTRNGRLNMLACSKPRKPGKGEPPGLYWHDGPARLDRLYSYCKQDVEVERALHHRIGFLPPEEQAVWELDAAINDRGVFVDVHLAARRFGSPMSCTPRSTQRSLRSPAAR